MCWLGSLGGSQGKKNLNTSVHTFFTMVRTIKIDENAYELINKVKDLMREEGIECPSYSDAVRWLWNKLKEEDL